ncbi:hypothetical protein GCM10018785_27050 [Streptomyces longispororuber]|uniref:Uncharacterized protein n=1 Tax=Streptomyces longispororuber TaxID=68230 RepID=A0A918ZJL4_9ACTN|nr:hypothetical protein [Streptomyces longispororuber]GHE56340.1 hypothetical protein GCM10018785_27050 [Streptomyces longispororuber]
MSSFLRARGRIGQRTLLLAAAAVLLTGWAVHVMTLYKPPAARREQRLARPVRVLHTRGVLEDGLTTDPHLLERVFQQRPAVRP